MDEKPRRPKTGSGIRWLVLLVVGVLALMALAVRVPYSPGCVEPVELTYGCRHPS